MENKIILAPSILSANFACLLDQIKQVEQAGAQYLHVDVMDGHFVPNISFGAPILRAIKGKHSMVTDVHLMIENPAQYIPDFVSAGADIITVHYEACTHLHRVIEQIKSYGIKAGVSLNPATPVHLLDEILPYVDMVLIMSVNPGFGGQKFIPTSLQKIKLLKEKINTIRPEILIEVDGGVTTENVHLVHQAGADIVVAGSAVFGKKNIKEAVYEFFK